MKLANSITFALIFIFSRGVRAHYKWPALIYNNAVTPDYTYVRPNTNNIDPIMDVTSISMRCNAGGSTATSQTLDVNAGDALGFTLSNVISHIGPVQVYLARAPGSVASWDGSGAVWFKISEWGPVISQGSINWPQLGASQYKFTIPSATPSGQYLVRIEQIALHSAAQVGQAQFYISCGQIKINSGGNGSPGPLVALPGAYSATDPGILFNNYYPVPTNYVFPGPPVWP
ncbi:hypothetical protein TWF694_003634 [Orbilia ellipsospora]|uniref:lytic cellulose monooxygenase (C4-dehydrogenating) n=1 Tax=Orbilia ellipsospora TaxID=2528407 RepID=A0AAV9X044_9PEZI